MGRASRPAGSARRRRRATLKQTGRARLGECRRHPFTGTGKPEPLRGELKGWWSRRLTLKDRLVYRTAGSGEERRLEIAQ
ncbi:MAG: type II toxin-antitoxin system YoeB family toxin, partial [Caulobacteraceae bacterium]